MDGARLAILILFLIIIPAGFARSKHRLMAFKEICSKFNWFVTRPGLATSSTTRNLDRQKTLPMVLTLIGHRWATLCVSVRLGTCQVSEARDFAEVVACGTTFAFSV